VTAGEAQAVSWISHGPEETRCAGEALGRACRGGEVILLEGPLGAGKTVLAQGIAAGLGIVETVTSPTFTLLKEYAGRLPLAHFDFYRVDPQRAVDVEFDDYLGAAGVCAVEWASRVPHVVPPAHLLITLSYAPDPAQPAARLVHATAAGPTHTALLDILRACRTHDHHDHH
jgi:tRNA threonylcarbamoyladenosine biosynthesis protein TsaE